MQNRAGKLRLALEKTGAQIVGFLFVWVLASCASQPANQEYHPTPTPPPSLAANPPKESLPPYEPLYEINKDNEAKPEPTPPELSNPPNTTRPKIGLILGPGGLRAYAHAGLLQELAKAKIPVFVIGGIEMGALPAALFAFKGQPFEPEWQMMKLKEGDLIQKSLLSGPSPLKADTIQGPLTLMFGQTRVEDAKIAFMCPSYSMAKKQTFLMNRGPFATMLMYCIPSFPLFENYRGNGANLLALTQMLQALKQKGAELLIYVDLLTENSIGETEAGFNWGIIQQALEAQSRGAAEVIRVSGLAGVKAFSKRHEMVVRGQEAGRKLVQTLQTNYGY